MNLEVGVAGPESGRGIRTALEIFGLSVTANSFLVSSTLKVNVLPQVRGFV